MTQDDSKDQDLRRVRAELRALREELAAAPGIEDLRREKALQDIDDIVDILREPEGSGDKPWTERLERLALDFEASHPAAAVLVQRVANLLASMGI